MILGAARSAKKSITRRMSEVGEASNKSVSPTVGVVITAAGGLGGLQVPQRDPEAKPQIILFFLTFYLSHKRLSGKVLKSIIFNISLL